MTSLHKYSPTYVPGRVPENLMQYVWFFSCIFRVFYSYWNDSIDIRGTNYQGKYGCNKIHTIK